MPSVVPRRKAGAMIRVMFSAALAAAALLLTTPARAVAQVPVSGAQQDARVNEPAPVFLLPDETRTPLRTLPPRHQRDGRTGAGRVGANHLQRSAARPPDGVDPAEIRDADGRSAAIAADRRAANGEAACFVSGATNPTAAAPAAARQAVSSRIRHVRLRQNVRVRQLPCHHRIRFDAFLRWRRAGHQPVEGSLRGSVRRAHPGGR